MVKLIHWKATETDEIYTAQCFEYKDCKVTSDNWKDLTNQIEKQSKGKIGSCKVIITYYFDIK